MNLQTDVDSETVNKELEIWQFAAERLKQDEPVMLLVVAESSGSSPGRQGFKMIVAGDGLCGSIGGGVMEVKLVKSAQKILSSGGETLIKKQVHRKNYPDSSGMICSGEQTVLFFKLKGGHLKAVRKILKYLNNSSDRYLRITENGLTLTAKKLPPFAFKFNRQSAGEFIYEEKIGFKNRLFIVGGGHCALALSELMSKMDFHISLFDDRAGLNTLAKNKYVHEKHLIESYVKIEDYISSGENHFVVVMTLGYKTDEVVIRKLINKNFKYLGVLGSRAKMTTLLEQLEKENFSKEKLNNIRTPVGIPINSRTPEEIAVSIAAEIIQVKNNNA
jgi:xanthine dehydrogenase accessory factor